MSDITLAKPRVNFASVKNPLPYPDFLGGAAEVVPRTSFSSTLPRKKEKNEGLFKVFAENFPIADTRNNFVLEFLDYYIDPPRYTIDECLERGLTYSVPLKAKLKLYCTDPDHEDFATVIQDVYLGPIPYMTDKGTFVINGAERVVVSQLHRSPGVFFGQSTHANGTKLYSARIIPFRGSWIEFATDINNVMYAYIDRKKKLPVTTLLRAIGLESDKDIIEIFGLAEEIKVNKTNLKKAVGRKLAARVLKTGLKTSLTKIPVKLCRSSVTTSSSTARLSLKKRTSGNPRFGRADRTPPQGRRQHLRLLHHIQHTPERYIQLRERSYPVHLRQLRNAEPPDDASAREVITNLFFSEKRYDLGEVGRYRINKKLGLTTSMDVKVLTKEDIIAIIKYLIELINSKTDVDDIDHLSNRRVRTVGEQLYNQFNVGLARMSRTIRERMNVRDNEVFTPIDLINAKTISSVINTFFGTNALSQFMDRTNPLAEITLQAPHVGPRPRRSLSRERAGFEVRDVHYTHYGRLCPIETPEGPNIGLISSLCVYAKINDLGFIETPYREVKDGVVNLKNDEVVYLTAEIEEGKIIAQGNAPVNDNGGFINDRVKARMDADFPIVAPDRCRAYGRIANADRLDRRIAHPLP